MYIAPRQGQTNPRGQHIDVMSTETSCHFSHLLQVSKTISLKSDCIYIFNDFIYVYSPKAGAANPWGQNVDVNIKAISLCPFVASLKKTIFEV